MSSTDCLSHLTALLLAFPGALETQKMVFISLWRWMLCKSSTEFQRLLNVSTTIMAALTTGPTESPSEIEYRGMYHESDAFASSCSQQDSYASSRRAQAVHALVKDERRLREEREAFRSKRQEYSGFSRGDMLSAQGSATALGSTSLRRSVRHNLQLNARPSCVLDRTFSQPAHDSKPRGSCARICY